MFKVRSNQHLTLLCRAVRNGPNRTSRRVLLLPVNISYSLSPRRSLPKLMAKPISRYPQFFFYKFSENYATKRCFVRDSTSRVSVFLRIYYRLEEWRFRCRTAYRCNISKLGITRHSWVVWFLSSKEHLRSLEIQVSAVLKKKNKTYFKRNTIPDEN